jgi:hypothetical protein
MSLEHSPGRADLRTGGPRFGRIAAAEAHSGLKRTSLYSLAATHKGLFRKFGQATLVDLHLLDQILAALPAAEIGDEESAA